MDSSKRERDRERRRRRRERLREDPKLLEAARAEERERWKKRKQEGKIVSISEMSTKEKEKVRRRQRESTARYRAKQKTAQQCQLAPLVTPAKSVTKAILGRKKKNLNRSKVARENNKLKTECTELQKKVWKYQKRAERATKTNNNNNTNSLLLSPKSRVNKLVVGKTIPDEIKKELVFSEALQEDLLTLSKIKCIKVKQNEEEKKTVINDPLEFEKKKRTERQRNLKDIHDFFNRDDVTSVSPGKGRRNYKKLGGLLKRKRVLRGTITDLYQKYISEKKEGGVSYASFCEMKPVFVVSQSVSERRTCLCKICENFSLLCAALHSAQVVEFSRPTLVVQSVCCPEMHEMCLQRKCNICESKKVKLNPVSNKKLIFREKWVTIEEGEEGKRTVKRRFQQTVQAVKQEFQSSLVTYMSHYFRYIHQLELIRNLKNNVSDGQLIMHVDFSENYQCKYAEEIQPVYYGPSREQVIIHQGVGRVKGHTQAFCTFSKSTRKDAAGICALSIPILKYFISNYPGITTLHLVSDSPTTQYRNKETFFLTTRVLPSLFPQLTEIHHHFTEAGHGKCESDGVGGWAKTAADDEVSSGLDVSDFNSLISVLKRKSVKTLIETVDHTDILRMTKYIPKDLKPFKGTMKVHYYSWCKERKKEVYFSSVSCPSSCPSSCPPGSLCTHFGLPGNPWRTKSVAEGQIIIQPEGHSLACSAASTVPSNFNQVTESSKEVTVNSWVAVTFEGHWYPGIVDHSTKQFVWVNFMVRHQTNNELFLWPPTEDRHRINKKDILYILKSPPVATTRELFSIPEWEHIDKMLV